MNLFKRWSLQFRLWYRRRVAAQSAQKAPLREFVYLDEVSLFSLISSRLGPLASQFTDTQSRTLQSDTNSALSVSGAGLAASLGSKSQETRNASTQVVRKATVQATFKELYEFEASRLMFTQKRPVRKARRIDSPRLETMADLETLVADPDQAWAMNASSLYRGDLFEIEVRLTADKVYRFSHMFSTMSDIIRAEPDVFPGVVDGSFDYAASVNNVISHLLVGLIPLDAEATSYRVVRLQGRDLIVHVSLLGGALLSGQPSWPLRIAGVTEIKSYWQDTRRVLYSNLPFRILGRFTENGLKQAWNPVKLTELLKDAAPNLAEDLASAADSALANMGSTGTSAALEDQAPTALEKALERYVQLVASDPTTNPDRMPAVFKAPFTTEDDVPGKLPIPELRELFSRTLAASGLSITPNVEQSSALARMRSQALRGAGLDELALPVEESQPADTRSLTGARTTSLVDNLIEGEIVAIYW